MEMWMSKPENSPADSGGNRGSLENAAGAARRRHILGQRQVCFQGADTAPQPAFNLQCDKRGPDGLELSG